MPDRLSTLKGYVRMSWAPANLFNLHRLSYNPPYHLKDKLSFKRTSLTLFQQKWSSKRLLRAYHGDFIQERRFRRRFLPNGLPALEANPSSSEEDGTGARAGSMQDRIPLGSLMWRELEARLDVLVFRACFAHSVYEARRLVTQGHVKLNGKVTTDPNILLEPGDIYSVDPKQMYLLRKEDQPFQAQKTKKDSESSEEAAAQEGEEQQPAEGKTAEASVEAQAEESSSQDSAATPSSADAQTEASPEGSSEVTPTTDSSRSSSSTPEESTLSKSALRTQQLKAKASASSSSSSASSKSSSRREIPGLPFTLPDYAAPFIFIPAYLEVSFPTCSAIYVRHPTARSGYSEIPSPYDADGEVMRLGWEFYKGVGRRRRNVADWGDDTSAAAKSKGSKVSSAKDGGAAQYDDKGRRIWTGEWEELKDEQRRFRAVRQGRGRWAHRPL